MEVINNDFLKLHSNVENHTLGVEQVMLYLDYIYIT